MTEYIEREVVDKVIETARKMYLNDFGAVEVVQQIKSKLYNMPNADVQPIVYCKDCKYAQNPNDSMVYCTYFECGTMSQSDFCSQGTKQ